jgi:hypothetical protein
MRVQATINQFLVQSARWGTTGPALACSMLHGVRLGYAQGLLIGGVLDFHFALGAQLAQIVKEAGYACPPR